MAALRALFEPLSVCVCVCVRVLAQSLLLLLSSENTGPHVSFQQPQRSRRLTINQFAERLRRGSRNSLLTSDSAARLPSQTEAKFTV